MDLTQKIAEMIAVYPEKAALPCPVAHYIAAYLGIDPLEVGKVATRNKIKLYQCQLGLFGYGRKGKTSYKIIGRKVETDEAVLDQIRSRACDGRIACLELWRIADECAINRAEAGNAADYLGLKITPCQLGAF